MESKLKYILSYIVPFLTLCSTIWLYSFWYTFDINIFTYLEVSDILLSTIHPIISSLVLLAIYQLIGSSDFFNNYFEINYVSKLKTALIRIFIIFLIALALYFLYFGTDNKLFFYISLPLLSTILIKSKMYFVSDELLSKVRPFGITPLILNSSIISIILIFSYAKIFALNSIKNQKTISIQKSENKFENFKIIGETNKYLFTKDVENNTIIFEKEKLPYIKILSQNSVKNEIIDCRKKTEYLNQVVKANNKKTDSLQIIIDSLSKTRNLKDSLK